jgi:flagellar basal-body rod protein FlgB
MRGAGTSLALAGGMIDEVLAHENYQLAVRLLDAAALRHEALATNIANIETPGFKRLDLAPDFTRQLDAYAAHPNSGSLERLHPSVTEDRTTAAVRADGNNVELEHELIEMNRNSVEYEFLTQYASDSLKRLKTAITGRL